MPDPHKVSVTGRRKLSNYTGLGRTNIESHYRMLVDNLPAGAARPPLENFDSSDAWPWITRWIKATYETDVASLFVPADKKHVFPPYPGTGEQGHYDLSGLAAADGSIRIALAGDWGTGTDVAQQVADSMVAGDPAPELTIHLGDIYYVGLPSEVAENCAGANSGNYAGVSWARGTKGSFALNGNHEMYSGGDGYFDNFLPTLGIPTSQDQKQLTSYFCLETPVWRIIAIDTGYNSDTLSGDCHLEPVLIDWLQNIINPAANKKPTVLLSHHQWFSGFNDGHCAKPASQMAPFLQRQEFVWLWGHEHRLAIYNKYQDPQTDLRVYARCLGHGGMPVEMPQLGYPNPTTPQRVEYWDGDTEGHPARFQTLEDKTVVGPNGFVMMVIQGNTLTLEYLDADRTSLLKESFVPGGGGNWDGTLTRTIVNDPQILAQIIYE